MLFVLILWFCVLFRFLFRRTPHPSSGRRFVSAALPVLRARKPDWVIEEIVRLKAHMADAGCRRIADTFNRMHGARHATTVSKTWVAITVRSRRLEIEDKRRAWKRRIPKPMSSNLVWGLDLTGKADTEGAIHPVLGIVDHGSRLAVSLRALRDQTAITCVFRSMPGHHSGACRASIPEHAGPAFRSMPGRLKRVTRAIVASFHSRGVDGGASEVTHAEDSRGFAPQV